MIGEPFATPQIREEPSSGPQFTVRSPAPGSFVFNGTIDVIKSGRHFDLTWRESDHPPQTVREDEFLTNILARSRREVERFPTSSRARTNLAAALMNANRIDQAVQEFEAALNIDENNYSALAGLAAARLRQGNFDGAEGILRALRQHYPHHPAGPVMAAFLAVQRGMTDTALDFLQQAVTLDSKSALPRYLLGMVLMSGHHDREAVSQLRAAARLEPRSPIFQRGLGVAYAVRGDLRRAVKSFRASYALAPFVADAVHGLATVLISIGRSESAARILSDHLVANHGDRVAQELLARACRERAEFSGVRRHLLAALDSLQDDSSEIGRETRARLMNNIGAACFSLDSFAEADNWFKKSLMEDPQPTAFQNLYALCLRRDDLATAGEILQQWLANFPDDKDARVLTAIRHAERGDRVAGIGELRNLIGQGVTTPRAYGALGALLSEDDHLLDEALEIARVGCERFPRLPEMSNNLAYVHLLRGEVAEARQVLEAVQDSMKGSVHLTATYGLLKLGEGDVAAAEELYKEAAQLARELGRKKLSEMVRQKMHLELGRYFVRAGKRKRALAEIAQGLKISGKSAFRESLTDLRSSLQ